MFKKNIIKICLIGSLFCILPIFSVQAAYKDYTYKNKDDNYHLADVTTAADGSLTAAVGGSATVANSEVVVFTPNKKKPVWKFNPGGDEKIFDIAVSQDGSSIVACGSSVWLLNYSDKLEVWEYNDGAYAYDVCDISADGSFITAGNRGGVVSLWDRASSVPYRDWQISDVGYFVTSLMFDKNADYLLASSDQDTAYIDIRNNDIVWSKQSATEIIAAGMAKNKNNYGYIVRRNEDLSSGDYKLSAFNINNGNVLWTKYFSSFNTPRVALSNNGKRLVLTTNNKYYGFHTNSGKKKWDFERSGGETELSFSGNGKYIAVSEGHGYVYLFDWAYPHLNQRPFQIDEVTFPGSISLDNKGSVLAYDHNDFTLKQLKPGILVKDRVLPVYSAGIPAFVNYFITNPTQSENLEIRTTFSLPQVAILSDLGATVSGEPKSVKGKLLEYANKSLPGYEIVDERSADLNAQKSRHIKTNFLVPDLIFPDWLGDLIDFLGLDEFFEGMLGDYYDPLVQLVNNNITDSFMTAARDAKSAETASYALIGSAQIQLYDSETNEVYSTDNFFFLYLAL